MLVRIQFYSKNWRTCSYHIALYKFRACTNFENTQHTKTNFEKMWILLIIWRIWWSSNCWKFGDFIRGKLKPSYILRMNYSRRTEFKEKIVCPRYHIHATISNGTLKFLNDDRYRIISKVLTDDERQESKVWVFENYFNPTIRSFSRR